MATLSTFFLIAIFNSCKKTGEKIQLADKKLYAEMFFKKPAVTTPELDEIIDYLKTENERTGFLKNLPDNAGLPVWNKIIVENYKTKPGYAARGIITDTKGNILIPLSSDDKTLSALLFAIKHEEDYEFYCYNNDYAYHIVFDDKHSINHREYVMALFMSMSNYVFGIHEFKNVPIGLFKDLKGPLEANGTTKKINLVPEKGIPPDIFTSDRVIGTISLCGWQFTGYCTCHSGCFSTSCCDHPYSECPTNTCTEYKCLTIIFEQEDPPAEPGGSPGSGTPPSSSGSTTGGGTNGTGTGPLPKENNPQTSPNPPCSNCPWYTESQTEDPKLDCGPGGFTIGNYCVSPENYPGKEQGYQFKWWSDQLLLAPYGGLDFGHWAIDFLVRHPNISFPTFQNWFFNTPEYTGGEEAVDPTQITYEEPVTQEVLPSLSSFEANFPKNGTSPTYTQMPSPDVYELAGGSIYQSHLLNPGQYSNACAVRGSRGLLYSGIQIPVLRYNNSQRTQKGGDNKNYILDAISFNKFMNDKFGATPYTLTGADANDPGKVAALLNGKNGIYVIVNNNSGSYENGGAGYSGHVDLILNGNCVGGAYTTPQGGVKSISIWVLN